MKEITIVELNSTKKLGQIDLESGQVTLTEVGTGFLRLPLRRHGVVINAEGATLGRVSPSKSGCVITIKNLGTGRLKINTPQEELELLEFQAARAAYLDSL